MKRRGRWQHWMVLGLFALLAITLFLFPLLVQTPPRIQDLVRAVGEALIVAIVVALAVEPRLLRYFGDELATQTFWSSFYSRAPEPYREAVKELASAEQFSVAINWDIELNWADDQMTIIEMLIDCTNHVEHRGSKPHGLQPRTFVYESVSPAYVTKVRSYTSICQGAAFYSDLIKDGIAKIEQARDGRLLIIPARDRQPPYFYVPPNGRYTVITNLTTYVGEAGHFPLVVTRPTLDFTMRLRGTALTDLYLSILHPGRGSIATVTEGPGKELYEKGRIQVGGVFITGQAVMLSWKKQ